MIKDSVAFQLSSVITDDKGRYIILHCTLNSKNYTLVSLYAPNRRQLSFIKKVILRAKETKFGDLIVCGDFNTVVNSQLDRSGSSSRNNQDIQTFIAEEGIHDIWRYSHSTEKDYTFYSNPNKTHSRIDLFLVDSFSLPRVLTTEIGVITWSDHAPITLSLDTAYNTSSRPPWRLNLYVLKNKENIATISSQLEEFFSINAPSVSSPTTVWCAHKAFIRGILMKLTARQKRIREQKLTKLVADLQIADANFKAHPSPLNEKTLNSLRTELRLLYLHQYDHHLAKMKWNFYLQGDRPSKILARRVKQTQARTRIPYMVAKDRTKSFDPQAIANIFADYYQDLYNLQESDPSSGGDPDIIDSFLSRIPLPSLSRDQLDSLNCPFSMEEITVVLRNLKFQKSPGPDGLPNEYYKTFADTLLPHCSALFNAIVQQKAPPAEMLKAIITTIPKPGKSTDDPANFRPISLLNSDIKMFSKLLANRINLILPQLISPDQVGFVYGRQARDGTRRVLDLIQIAHLARGDAVLLSLDAEKAFDRVNWQYMQKVLFKFGFTGQIFDAINSLYTCPSATVFTSGFFSRQIPIANGTRQGCPLSPLIFALAVEPLAELIRKTPEITGLSVNNTEHKISLYADDILVVCTNPTQSVPALLQLLQDYSAVSGYKLNRTKSTIFPLKISTGVRENISQYQFQWSTSSITYLGIQLASTPYDTIQENYTKLAECFETECKSYQSLCMSWIARVSIVKMFLLPKFIYLCRTIPYIIPRSHLDKLQSILLKCIWNGRRARVNKMLMYRDANLGGLGVPQFGAYNVAAILDPVAILWSPSSSQRWALLENESLGNSTNKDLLIALYLGLPTPDVILQSTLNLMETWSRWVLKCCWLYVPKEEISLKSFFMRSLVDLGPIWEKYGLTSIQDFYMGDSLKSFADLSAQYDIPRTMFYRYLQSRHALTAISWPTPPTTPLPFRSWLCSHKQTIKGISLMYKLQLALDSASKSSPQIKWEKELRQTFTIADWSAASQAVSKFSRCINHKEIMRKIHLRWYLTPNRLKHIKPGASDLCWRGCGALGTQYHMWWQCPVTRAFWRRIQNMLTELFGYNFLLSPALAILDLGSEDVPFPHRTALQHILIGARFVIAQHWNSPASLPLAEVITRVNFQCHCEIKLITSPKRSVALRDLWEPWIGSRFYV